MTHPLTARHGGLWSRVKDADGYIDPDAWQAALDARQHVGTCIEAGCGQPLRPEPPETEDRRVTWYPARCITCGHVVRGRSPRPSKGAA